MNLWHEALKRYRLKSAPPGHRRITWSQLQTADEALWLAVGAACVEGTKAKHDDVSGKTQFEAHFARLMFDQDVRTHLSFLQNNSTGGPPGSSTDVAKLHNRISNLEQQLAGQKRKTFDHDKGKGKNKNRRGNDYNRDRASKPAAFGDLPAKTPSGHALCFNFNLPVGCPPPPR